MQTRSVAATSLISTISVLGWRDLPWLVHGFSTRSGGRTTVYQAAHGQSRPEASPCGELNLGFTAEDEREKVSANRELLLDDLLGHALPKSSGLVTLRQIHSAVTHRVDPSHLPRSVQAAALEGDGLMTDAPNVLLGILTADCVPVLVVDPVHRAVAAFHAGWRGTVQQIVEHGIERMRQEFSSVPGTLLAAVGPAIGACCYTVGEEVIAQFSARFAYAGELLVSTVRAPFTEDAAGWKSGDQAGTARLDLAESNRRQLLGAGVPESNISMTGACTSCETKRFFSHRAERGVTGRMMAVIGVRGD